MLPVIVAVDFPWTMIAPWDSVAVFWEIVQPDMIDSGLIDDFDRADIAIGRVAGHRGIVDGDDGWSIG